MKILLGPIVGLLFVAPVALAFGTNEPAWVLLYPVYLLAAIIVASLER